MTAADRVQAIRARLAAATPGPWFWVSGEDGFYNRLETRLASENVGVLDGVAFDDFTADVQADPADAELIASAPADLAWALDRIAHLERVVERLSGMASTLDKTAKVSVAELEELSS